MPTVKRLRPKAQALKADRPRLFDVEPVTQRTPRELIKACVRSGYPFTPVTQAVLQDMLRDVGKFGRLDAPRHRLLMVFARKAGVG
jgi:hypothetical protein